MSNSIKKSVAFLLSGLVLLSAWGFSVDRHFCQGKLINTRFFSSAPACSVNGVKGCPVHPPASKASPTPQFHRPPCCQNAGAYLHVDVNGKSASEITSLEEITIPAVLPQVDLKIVESRNASTLVLWTRWMHPHPLLRSHRRWTSSFRC
ncbi:MAG: hypothetical protein K9I85_14005 [Saprospiraceae bacterium]|nr:hypothetical protein [Saprospiraceae bacterium]